MLAASGFAFLSLLAGASWRGKPLGLRFIAAFVAMTLWAIAIVLAAFMPRHAFSLIYFSELLRNCALLWAIMGVGLEVTQRWFRVSVYLLGIAALIAGLMWANTDSLPVFASSGVQLMTRVGLLFTFAGVVCLEQIYRNAGGGARSSLQYLVLGFGCIFAYDLFLYSQAELFRQLRQDAWSVRGFVTALAVPFLVLGVRRNPNCSLDIFVSRQVVTYTAAFLLVGVYLLFVAAGGYYVRAIGGTWSGVAQIFFFSGAIVVFAGTLFSGVMQRRTKVFIAKHFYRNKYDYRVEWLRFVRTLSTQSNLDIYSRAVYAIAQTIGSQGGILFLRDEYRRSFVCRSVWPADLEITGAALEVADTHQLAQFLQKRKWIIDLVEYRRNREMYENVALPAWLDQQSTLRIVVPVLELDRLSGFMMLVETNPPLELTYEDRDLLKTLGSHVATYLAQHDANTKLAESRQFEAYNRLTAFMMHDLKNSVAQLKLIVSNAARHKSNPAFIDDSIDTVANTADRMTRLIDQLSSTAKSAALRRVDLNEAAALAVTRCADRQPVATLTKYGEALWVRADADQLQASLEHLIRNAQDATPANGRITVVTTMSKTNEPCLSITDTGHGMEQEFLRERLFKPFDSTKGSKGMGIGAYQVREYMTAIDGNIEVRSRPGSGTTFELSFKNYSELSG